MNIKKKTLEVLHQDDLEQFLKKFRLFDDFKKGILKCYCCNTPITIDNICALMISGQDYIFLCNKESCYETYLKLKKGGSEDDL